jgi:hypothetical protein
MNIPAPEVQIEVYLPWRLLSKIEQTATADFG